ncbi:MAG: N-acetylglucosamine-6-phosphate deacetylase [Ruminococcaceae bacterium]|nr:N-acetylglucosamine-6-phosphate deacetylase [Oscillospiraceae bacterium]
MKKAYIFKKITNNTDNCLIIEDNKIIDTCQSDYVDFLMDCEIVSDYENYIAMPGFIDCHMHGALGIDVSTCTAEELVELAKGLYKHGVAAFMPTIPAAMPEQNKNTLKEIKKAMELTKDGDNMSLIIGCHMEGPFMCPKYKGALDENAFCDATVENWNELTGEYADVVKRITADPLCDGLIDMIPYFTEHNIQVSLGHTDATADVIYEAFEKGATSVTHLYNAMSPLHHREPGTVGAALSSDETYAEIITDFLHVNPKAVKLAIKAKTPSKIAVITDSCQAAGMPDGEYVLGGRLMYVINGEARMPEGQLASSTVFMDKELKNLLYLGFNLDDCALMLSTNPAYLSGIECLGTLEPGKMAVISVVDNNGDLITVL